MSLREFDALDPMERDLWLADWQAEQGECSAHHGPLEDCSDPKQRWYPYRVVCYATMEVEAAQAAYESLHEEWQWHNGTFTSWAKERSDSHPYHYTHGVRIGVAKKDLAPWDMFTTDRDASPVSRGPHQLDSQADEAGDEGYCPDRNQGTTEVAVSDE